MFAFANLDARIRLLMLDELDAEIRSSTVYFSRRLLATCKERYIVALRAAFVSQDESWLADQVQRGMLCDYEWCSGKKREYERAVPENAHVLLAECEFNRFYMRGVCRAAIEDGQKSVLIYRARASSDPRVESERLIGTLVDATALLDNLRQNPGCETEDRLLPSPGSGLSVQLIDPPIVQVPALHMPAPEPVTAAAPTDAVSPDLRSPAVAAPLP